MILILYYENIKDIHNTFTVYPKHITIPNADTPGIPPLSKPIAIEHNKVKELTLLNI